MPDIQTRLADLERQRTELSATLASSTAVVPLIPANLAKAYRDKLARLGLALVGPDNTAALEIGRGLIEKVVISPPVNPGDPPGIELIGDLANMLKAGGFEPQPSEQLAVQAHLSAMLDSSVKGGNGLCPFEPRQRQGPLDTIH